MKDFNLYNPEVYATSVYFRQNVIENLVKNYGDKLKWQGGERILDIGCGVGDITRLIIYPMLSEDYKLLACADASSEMLSVAQKKLEGIRNITFLEMDIEGDQDESLKGTFDKIFSTFCFMYLKNQKKAFQNVFDLLIPGGECFIVITVTGIIFEATFQLVETPKWREHLKYHRDTFVFPYRDDPDPEKTLKNLLELIGFKDIFVKKENFYGTFPTKSFLRDTMKVLSDYKNNMTKEEKDELLEDQIKVGMSLNAIEECRDKSKPINCVRHVVLVIHARKP